MDAAFEKEARKIGLPAWSGYLHHTAYMNGEKYQDNPLIALRDSIEDLVPDGVLRTIMTGPDEIFSQFNFDDPDLDKKADDLIQIAVGTMIDVMQYDQLASVAQELSVLRKCSYLHIFRPDFKLYKSCSRAFKSICKLYSPTIEEFSIDECFLDMNGIVSDFSRTVNLAHEIKDRIKNELGFTVNVGIGENKLCAKMASDFEKPDKVHTLFQSEVPTKMWPLPVGNLLFVGVASATKLNSLGIHKIGQLANAKIEFLLKHFGNKRSIYMHNFANVLDDSPVVSERPEPKGYSNSITLEKNLSLIAEANTVLLALADAVTQHMRKGGNKVHSISVGIRFLNFKNISHQTSFSEPLSTTNEVYEAAKKLLQELWKGRRPIRLISISLTNLTKLSGCKQLSFFDKPSKQVETIKKSDEKVNIVIDK